MGLPNTYAYTKALTEDLVYSYAGRIPLVITRPSIGMNYLFLVVAVLFYGHCLKMISIVVGNVVTAALKEPYPGWIEGMNGPTGLMIGAARGVVRSMHCNPDFPADIVPVDIAINAIIAAAYERGHKHEKESVDFFNVVLTPGTLPSWGNAT